jgi:hypothetical protein
VQSQPPQRQREPHGYRHPVPSSIPEGCPNSPHVTPAATGSVIDAKVQSQPPQRQRELNGYRHPVPSSINRCVDDTPRPRRPQESIGEGLLDLAAVVLAGLQKGLMLMLFGFGIAALLGALIGAISAAGMGAYLHAGEGWGWQLWFALLSAVVGLLLGALGSGLGGAGVGLTFGTVVGVLREPRRVSYGASVLVGMMGALTGGLVIFSALILSGAGDFSMLALLLQVMPSQLHVVGLCIVWGMVGGLVSSVALLDEM